MKKMRILAGGALAGIVLVLVLHPFGPRYQGRSAAHWIKQLGADNASARHEAETAVRAMGTSTVPLLVERMKMEDSALRSNATALLRQQNLIPAPSSPAAESRQEAVRGFQALGSGSAAAVAALVRLLDDPRTADHASYALIQMNNGAIPALLIAATNSGLQVRRRVIADLGARHSNAPGVAATLAGRLQSDPDPAARCMAALSLGGIPDLPPNLIQVLVDALGNPVTSAYAAQALGNASAHAQIAIPVLEDMVAKQDLNAPSPARQALVRIDPTAPARLGFTAVVETNRYE